MSTTIDLANLSKSFGASRPAVDRVSLRIDAGELFFLLGPSGCGKTTLLRMIAGFIDPTAGSIIFTTPQGPREVTHLPPNKRDTGMVFQSYALWPHMSVEANVAFGLQVKGVGTDEKKRRVAEALRLVRMEEYAARKPTQLSGGQQQRVALARALVVRPDVLLLDEPLSNLDAKLRVELRSEIRRICKEARTASSGQGMTAVYVTHDQKEALSMADRIAIMRDGKVVQVGQPRELYANPVSAFVAEFLGETNFIPGTVATAGERPRISTAAGQLVGRATAPLPLGAPVVCSIRPEAIRLAGADRADTNRVAGTIADTAYLGEMAQLFIHLRPAAGTPPTPALGVRMSLLHPVGPARSGDVLLEVDADDVVCLPAPA
jgi:iron(III) transport system ATP-binding protein